MKPKTRRKFVLVLAGLAALGGAVWLVVYAIGLSASDDYEAAMREAVDLAKKGNHAEALTSLAKAKAAKPSEITPYSMAADVYVQSDHYREALEEMRKAHSLAPNDPEVTLKLLKYTPPYL